MERFMKKYVIMLLTVLIGIIGSPVTIMHAETKPSTSTSLLSTSGLKYTLIKDGTEYGVSKGSANMKETIIIPASYKTLPVTVIQQFAFYGCSKLKNITIPNTIRKIDTSAFKNCYSLKNISLPNSITEIKENAFDTCMKLTEISIPNKMKTIKMSTFYGCLSLKKVTIPASVTSIEAYAFSGCNINDVTMLGEHPPKLGSILPFRIKSMKIYLPSKKALKAFSSIRLPWNNYSIFYIVRKK